VAPLGALHVAATLALWGLAGALYWRSGAPPSTLASAASIATAASA